MLDMKAELTARLRQQVQLELELGRRSLEELAIAADLSVTTLRRFLDDGELSLPAGMRLAHAVGWVKQLRVNSGEATPRSRLVTQDSGAL